MQQPERGGARGETGDGLISGGALRAGVGQGCGVDARGGFGKRGAGAISAGMDETKPADPPPAPAPPPPPPAPGEQGGPKGPEPTRYGDWERGGRAFDF